MITILSILAAISGSGLINALIYLLIAGIICGLVLWLVGKSPIPEPFKNVITWIVYAVAVLVLINFLLSLIGRPLVEFGETRSSTMPPELQETFFTGRSD